jgi:hypothetical protein
MPKSKVEKRKKKESFNFKEWLKIALDLGSRRGKRDKEIPKIKTPFKLLLVNCKKSDINILNNYVSTFGTIIGLDFTCYYIHKDSNAILSGNKESVLLTVLVPTDKVDGRLEEIANELKKENIKFYKLYVITPTSAELNLIYQFK